MKRGLAGPFSRDRAVQVGHPIVAPCDNKWHAGDTIMLIGGATNWPRTRGTMSAVHSTRPRPVKLQAAIVDLDGTMVDTLGDFAVALNRMLDELQLPPIEPAAIELMVGRGSEHLIRSVLQHVAAPPGLYERAWQSYQTHYLAINGLHSVVYAGVVEGLHTLKQAGLKLACITNKPTDFARPLLQAKGLAGFFEVVFGGDAFERKKPDPLPLLKACEALGSTPETTLMIGDSSNDAAAARAAGCPVLLVTYGYNHGAPVLAVDADGFVDSLAELPRWLSLPCPAGLP